MNAPPRDADPPPADLAAVARRRRPDRARFEARKRQKRLLRLTAKAIGDFNMIGPGDRVMVCLSGGKDSHALLDLLLTLQRRAPFRFELVAVNLDQKQPGFPAHVLPEYLGRLGVPFHIETQDTYSIVKRVIPAGGTMCSLCSRLRRGILYRVATELGATRIALGHHRDDIVGTFFLNLFYGGKLKAMPAKLVSDDGRHVVIRPLAYVTEDDLAQYAVERGFPIIPCSLCGSQEHLKRKVVRRMMAEWEREQPGRVDNVFNALSRVVSSHLMDHRLRDFRNLVATGQADPDGDLAFDEPALDAPVDAAAADAATTDDETAFEVAALDAAAFEVAALDAAAGDAADDDAAAFGAAADAAAADDAADDDAAADDARADDAPAGDAAAVVAPAVDPDALARTTPSGGPPAAAGGAAVALRFVPRRAG